MDASPAAAHAHRVLQVQHFVVHQVFNREAWDVRAVEDAADHDGVVRGIVVAQQAARVVAAPCEHRPSQQTVEEAPVDRLEDLFQIVEAAHGGMDLLASARLPGVFGLPADGFRRCVTAVAVGVRSGDRLAIELGKQDVRDGFQYGLRRGFQQV